MLSASKMFEHLRQRLAGGHLLPSLPRLRRRSWKEAMLRKFRYALCCIEETNRVHSLKLLVEQAQKASCSVRELGDELAAWKEKAKTSSAAHDILAYRLA